MSDIKDLEVYNSGMKKSLLDKIYFMDKVDAKVFIDYGCADGTLIKFLRDLFPEFTYFGYDISEEMISQAKINNPEIANHFTSDWNFISDRLPAIRGEGQVAIILSSIIHEVYSYGTSSDVNTFWDRVYGGWDYILIRDMMPGKSIDRRTDINDVSKIYKKADRKHLFDFEQVWGSIENNKNLIHYFLKYRYTENWDREVRENYLPMSREEMLANLPDGYEITFHEHFILPFLKTKVQEDFGIELKDSTHIKIILKKKEV